MRLLSIQTRFHPPVFSELKKQKTSVSSDFYCLPNKRLWDAGKLPFPDGAIIAALHYGHVPSEENNKVFGRVQSFVPGPPTNIQFMVKDSKKYAAAGGWGFGHFNTDGKPGNETLLKTCSPCHAMASRDFVFICSCIGEGRSWYLNEARANTYNDPRGNAVTKLYI